MCCGSRWWLVIENQAQPATSHRVLPQTEVLSYGGSLNRQNCTTSALCSPDNVALAVVKHTKRRFEGFTESCGFERYPFLWRSRRIPSGSAGPQFRQCRNNFSCKTGSLIISLHHSAIGYRYFYYSSMQIGFLCRYSLPDLIILPGQPPRARQCSSYRKAPPLSFDYYFRRALHYALLFAMRRDNLFRP